MRSARTGRGWWPWRRHQPPSPTGWTRERPPETQALLPPPHETACPVRYPLKQPESQPLSHVQPLADLSRLPAHLWTERNHLPPGRPGGRSTTGPIVMPRAQFERLPTLPTSSHRLQKFCVEPLPPADPAHLQAVSGPVEMPDWLSAVVADARTPPVGHATGEIERNASWLNDGAKRVWSELEPAQTTGALEQLEALALRHNSDTLEVPTVMKKKHERKESE